jgi:hypothetical protein
MDYLKICGSRAELEAYAQDEVGGEARPCRRCNN